MVDQLSMFSLILSLGPPLNSWIPRGFLSGSWKQRCSYSFCCWISCVNISWSFIVFTVNMFLLVLRSKIVSLPNCFECLGKVWCLYLFLKDSVNKSYIHAQKKVCNRKACSDYNPFSFVIFFVEVWLFSLLVISYAEFSGQSCSTACITTMLTLTSYIPCRFPSTVKTSNLSKYEATPAKGSLTSGRLSPPRIDTPAQPQPDVDLVFC